MFVNTLLNGFLLLLTFGLLCGLLAGALFGTGIALYFAAFSRSGSDGGLYLVFAAIGAVYGLVPGVLYGLSSYYFTNRGDWLFTGGAYGAIPGFVLFFGFGLEWRLLLIVVSYGVLIGFLNVLFPNWWGMRLRAEGIALLKQSN